MSYTTSELAAAVLRHLSVIDASETADSADESYITDIWSAKWEELSSHGTELTYFPHDDIPNPVFLIIRDLVALEVQGNFGQPIDAATKEQLETVILRRLRKHVQVQRSNKPVRAEYF